MVELFAIDDRARLELAPERVLEADEDVRAEAGLGNLPVIGIDFARWRDGRGYSSARILREQGYAGDIRAIGDLTVDQLVFLKRCGFSSLAAERAIDAVVAEEALARFPFVYQRGTDPAAPAWALRHGAAG
jgi:uncharacterized protein (DUF934 family)